ncbi:hypothetical protein D3C73_961140 [compost metagenome]
MCLLALHFGQGESIGGQRFVGDKLIQLLYRKCKNLRCYKRQRFAGFNAQLLCFLRQRLIGRCRSVFILAHMRVYIEAFGQQ